MLSSMEEDSLWAEEGSLSEDAFRRRLHRRTRVIDELRKAYLRDVVAVRSALDQLDAPAKQRVAAILGEDTCVDLEAPLKLFAPAESILEVKPCEACGGTMELTYQFSSEIQKLNVQIEQMRQKHVTLNQEFAKTRGDLFAARETIEQMKHGHAAEQLVFLEQATMLKSQLSALTASSAEMKTTNQKLKGENMHFRVSLEHQTTLISELHRKLEQYRADDETQRKLLTESEDLFDDYQAACVEMDRLRTENDRLQERVGALKEMIDPLQANYDTLQEQISLLFDAAGLRGRSAEELRRMQNDMYQARLRAKTQQREYDVLEKRIAEREQQEREQQSKKLPVTNPANHNSSSAEQWRDRRTGVQQQLLRRASKKNVQNDVGSMKAEPLAEDEKESPKLSLPNVVNRSSSGNSHQNTN